MKNRIKGNEKQNKTEWRKFPQFLLNIIKKNGKILQENKFFMYPRMNIGLSEGWKKGLSIGILNMSIKYPLRIKANGMFIHAGENKIRCMFISTAL